METTVNGAEVERPRESAERLATRILDVAGAQSVTDLVAPQRCRGILISRDGKHVAVMRRTKPGVVDYAPFPGGGLEDDDETPLAGLMRELGEEFGVVSDQVSFVEDRVIAHDEQWVFVGFATSDFELQLGGPELERMETNPANGTYEPAWVPIESIADENVVPADLRSLISKAITDAAPQG